MLPDSENLCKAIYQALRAALGLSDSEANAHLFRAYQDPPPPEPEPGSNVCYYWLETDTGSSFLRETTVTDSVPEAASCILCRLILVFYGPDCETWAHRCRNFLFLDGAGMPRQILRSRGLFPVPDRGAPAIVYEEEGKTWRKRADLVLRASLLDHADYASVLNPGEPIAVNTVSEAPEVFVQVSGG